MRKIFLALVLAAALGDMICAQTPAASYDLPPGALVIETRPLELGDNKHRAFVLWMLRPSKHPRDSADMYTCPEETRGSYYRGPARVSLVDTDSRRVINTVRVNEADDAGDDNLDLPYRIEAGHYYYVPNTPDGKERKPEIMLLKDYNGDGEALEFALFNKEACMPVMTTLIGYSRAQDKVVWYPIRVETEEGGKTTTETGHWMDYLFTTAPDRPGHWKYDIDYRGRGGTLDKHEVSYNAGAERFEGRIISVGDGGN